MNKPPYICPRCNEPTRTTIQRTDSTIRYCSPCYHELNEADARLGRMVRKLAATNYVLSPVQIYQANGDTLEHIATRWAIQQWIGNGSDGLEDVTEVCDTPEAALEAAGIKDE